VRRRTDIDLGTGASAYFSAGQVRRYFSRKALMRSA
jgi:hypothetical protein